VAEQSLLNRAFHAISLSGFGFPLNLLRCLKSACIVFFNDFTASLAGAALGSVWKLKHEIENLSHNKSLVVRMLTSLEASATKLLRATNLPQKRIVEATENAN
jgi:hypothetical protein